MLGSLPVRGPRSRWAACSRSTSSPPTEGFAGYALVPLTHRGSSFGAKCRAFGWRLRSRRLSSAPLASWRSVGTAARAYAPSVNGIVPLTSFVGRRAELAQLRSVLAGARLLTLVGPAGTGKTRLALELARR